jgi:hypothetical protein
MYKVLIVAMTLMILYSPVFAEPEEDADMVMITDKVIEGVLKGYTDKDINIEEEVFTLCDRWHLYDKENRYTDKDLLRVAYKIKVFIDKRRDCVRKIKILEFSD